VLAVLGVADADLIFAAADAVADGDGRAVLETVERLSRSGRDSTQYIRDLIAHMRQLLVVRTAEVVPAEFTLTAAQDERLRGQAERIGDAALVRSIDELSAALSAIREWGDDARTALEMALLKSARPDVDPSREALAQRVERLERGFSGPVSVHDERVGAEEPRAEAAQADPPEPAPHASESDTEAPEATASAAVAVETTAQGPAGADEIDLERIAGLWPAVLDQVRQSGSELLSAVFQAARPVAVDAERGVLEIGFPPSAAFNKRKAEAQANRDRLEEAVRTIVGESLRPVYVLLDTDDAESENGGEPALSEEELIDRIKSEFDAEEFEAEEESK
jgi:DNA polymerase-3 subunit gamma/tau